MNNTNWTAQSMKFNKLLFWAVFVFKGVFDMDKKKKSVSIGDKINFFRKDVYHEGIVYQINEKSVLVELTSESQAYLGYENNRTVVNHKNYIIQEHVQVS